MKHQSHSRRGRVEAHPGKLLGLLALAFVALGLPDGLLGVAWPSMQRTFALPAEAVGAVLVPFTASYVLSSFASGAILSRSTVGELLAASCLVTGASLLGYALAPAWSVVVLSASVGGLGAGAIDAGVNFHVARHHSPRMLNWMHAAYGAGAALGPLIMTAVLASQARWQAGYAIVAVGQVLLGGAFAASRSVWPPPRALPDEAASAATSLSSTLCSAQAWLGAVAFFTYTGLEAVTGVWMYSFLTSVRSTSPLSASSAVALYWATLTGGRLLVGASVGRASLGRRLRQTLLGLAAAAGGVCIAGSPVASVAAFAALGFAARPVFPSLMAETSDRVPPAQFAGAVGFQVASAALGQSLLPTFAGLLARGLGLAVLGPMLLATALLLFALHEVLLGSSAGGRRRAHWTASSRSRCDRNA